MGIVQPQQQAEQPPEPEFVTPELAARWRKVKKLIASNEQQERGLQQLAGRYGAQVTISPVSILQLKFQVMMDLLWPRDTAEGQDMRLRHDEVFHRRAAENLEVMRETLGQQLLGMGAQVPPDEMAKLLGAPAGLVRQGGPERRSRSQ